MKKILTALLSLALIMNMAACGDYAPNELEYPYILEDGVLTISVNTDEMEIFYESREMWIDQIHTVILDDSVRSIGKDAFQDYPNLKRIIFNDRVDDIGPGAFAGTGLILEEFPDSLRYIGEEAFAGCTVPETLVIPKNVRKIEQGAFANVKGLKTLVLLGHTEVAQNTHNETGPNSVFENTGLSQVILPESYQGTHHSELQHRQDLLHRSLLQRKKQRGKYDSCVSPFLYLFYHIVNLFVYILFNINTFF